MLDPRLLEMAGWRKQGAGRKDGWGVQLEFGSQAL